MKFRKYNSIENTYQNRFIEKSFYALDWYDDFIVQEKIHWANFSFYVSSDWIVCWKRTSILSDNEKFFDWESVLKDNEARLLALQVDIWKDIIVYWELFWWWVQKWIFYSDKKQFYAFDIFVDWEYLSVDECNNYFNTYWFLYAYTLFRWTLDACMWYDIKHNSIIQQDIWEVNFDDWQNIMEWIVIRPNITKYTNQWERIIFKKKNEIFLEKKPPNSISFDTSSFIEYEQYINTNRLNSLISKIWAIEDKKEIQKYAWLLVSDIEKDIMKEWKELSKQAKKYIFQKSIKFILWELF